MFIQHDEVKNKRTSGAHDVQVNQINDALENLLDEKAAQPKWEGKRKNSF